MLKTNQSRFFIDLKHVILERTQVQKKDALVSFISSTIIELSKNKGISEQEKNKLSLYVQDYANYLIQKKTLLTKEPTMILLDALTCLRRVLPTLPEFPTFIIGGQDELGPIIQKNIKELQFYALKKNVQDELKQLFESPYDIKFYYSTKYPLKEQFVRDLVEAELPDIQRNLMFHTYTPVGNKDYLVTAEPAATGYHRFNLIYYSSDTIPVFRKLTFEHGMAMFNVPAEISCLSQLKDTIEFAQEIANLPKGKSKAVRIGYTFSQKKFLQLQKNGKVLVSKYPLEFVPIDLRVPLDKEIQCFFHKISDQLKDHKDPWRDVKLENFEKIKKEVLLFDPDENMHVLSDRRLFQEMVHEIVSSQEFCDGVKKILEGKGQKEAKFKVPHISFVDPKEPNTNNVNWEEVGFPLVVKTAAACGDKNTHFMAVVMNEEGLKEVRDWDMFKQYSYILQRYIEHDERIYKIYAIKDNIQVGQKQSLPNLTNRGIKENQFFFDSQVSFKDHADFGKLSKGFEPLEIDQDVVQYLTQELNRKLKLSLFGFDLIREASTGDYYLIDLNYFPGYTGFKDFKLRMHQHFYNTYLEYANKEKSE